MEKKPLTRAQEIKIEIKKSIEWKSTRPEKPLGGQQCGTPYFPDILVCEPLDIEIKIGYHRSSFKNKEIAMILLDLAIDELIK